MSTAKKITNDEVKSKNAVTKRVTRNNVEDKTKNVVTKRITRNNVEDKTKNAVTKRGTRNNVKDKTKNSVNQSKNLKKTEDKTKERGKSNKGKTKTDKPKKALERKFICDICDKRFALRPILTAHKRIHTGEKPFKCHDCGKAFTQCGTLIVHRRIHTGEKPFKCQECGKEFDQSSSYKMHLHTHSPEKRFKCTTCDKTFQTPVTLNQHLRQHKEKLPCNYKYVCKLCDSKFKKNHHLRRHLDSHEKPFHCSKCEAKFSRKRGLDKHTKIHDVTISGGKYKCEICKATFSSSKGIAWHHQTHVEVYGFVCNCCGLRKKTKGEADTHVKDKHLSNFNLRDCHGRVNLALKKKVLWEFWPHSRETSEITKRLNRPSCNICHISLPNPSALDWHSQSHHVNYPFKCAICGWRFRKQKYLDAHKDKVALVESDLDENNDIPGGLARNEKVQEENPDDPPLSDKISKTPDDPKLNCIFSEIRPVVNADNRTLRIDPQNRVPEKISNEKKKTKDGNHCKTPDNVQTMYEKKVLRERRAQVSYQEELSDLEMDIEGDDSDIDPDWFSDSSSESSIRTVDVSNRKTLQQLHVLTGASTNFEMEIGTFTSTRNKSLEQIGPVVRANEMGPRLPTATTIAKEPIDASVSTVSPVGRESPITRVPKEELLSPMTQIVIKQEPKFEEDDEESESKSELRMIFINQGYTPIRIYKPHIVIKKLKEEPDCE